ncbi:MAG: hypothetical protein V7731_07065 [Amphritea sp.]
MMSTEIDNTPAQLNSSNWTSPSPRVGSGHDARSSENGLLAIMYASLEIASRYDWLNAGRTLVDKTYINILWQAAELPAIGVTTHNIASDLDAFVRNHLQPLWAEVEHLSHEEKHQLAISLVEQSADSVFGSSYQEKAASWLLYYLCPQLPIFPLSEQLHNTVTPESDDATQPLSYANFHQACRQQFSRLLPHIHSATPTAEYGNEREIEVINQLLRSSDWWQRRCFINHLMTA